MALVFAPSAIRGVGERKDMGETMTDLTLDATSYSSGFAITAANVRQQNIDSVDVVSQQGSAMAPVVFHWDATNAKLRAYRQGAAAGVLTESSAGDFSTSMILRIRAKGAPNL